jgi:hypothetical protein
MLLMVSFSDASLTQFPVAPGSIYFTTPGIHLIYLGLQITIEHGHRLNG